MSRLLLITLLTLTLSPALAQGTAAADLMPVAVNEVTVTGGSQIYSVLITAAKWQTLEVPVATLNPLDPTTLQLTAPGLTLKITSTKRSSDGLRLQLALDVQRAKGFQNGPTTFTLQDAAGPQATFRLSVY